MRNSKQEKEQQEIGKNSKQYEEQKIIIRIVIGVIIDEIIIRGIKNNMRNSK